MTTHGEAISTGSRPARRSSGRSTIWSRQRSANRMLRPQICCVDALRSCPAGIPVEIPQHGFLPRNLRRPNSAPEFRSKRSCRHVRTAADKSARNLGLFLAAAPAAMMLPREMIPATGGGGIRTSCAKTIPYRDSPEMMPPPSARRRALDRMIFHRRCRRQSSQANQQQSSAMAVPPSGQPATFLVSTGSLAGPGALLSGSCQLTQIACSSACVSANLIRL